MTMVTITRKPIEGIAMNDDNNNDDNHHNNNNNNNSKNNNNNTKNTITTTTHNDAKHKPLLVSRDARVLCTTSIRNKAACL